MASEIKHTICFRCKPRCRLELEVENNQIVKVSTSPIKKCPRKWAPDLERFYHPDRLNYPLKRAGEKGENKWQEITWEKALDEIAAKLQSLKNQYGAETLGVTAGTSRTSEELNSRFLNLFGSPNQCGQAQICHGFDQLAQRAKEYPPDKVAEITWVPADQMQAAARMFAAETPSCAMEGPDTADELGLAEGDWAWIETQHGRVMQKVQIFEGIDPRVVHAQHGWWYPEMPGEEPWLHGAWVSNINVCTSSDEAECDEALGSWPLRTFQCKVYKVKRYGEEHPVAG